MKSKMSSSPLNKIFDDTLRGYSEPTCGSIDSKNTLEKLPITYQSSVLTHVGIEYEIENYRGVRRGSGSGDSVTTVLNQLWTVVDDGSLRNNGKEFVSRPISGNNIPLAISALGSYIEYEISKADPSVRCGIHVHVNAMDLTVTQLFGWISLYRIFERQLYKFSGNRDKNLFCLPTWAFDGHIMSALGYIPSRPGNAAVTLASNGYKYSGLNTKPLSRMGTLEFRQMQTVRDYDKIALWVEYLTRIKGGGSAECETTDGFIAYLEKLSNLNTSSEYTELLMSTFGERGKFLQFDGWKNDMAQGVIAVKEQLSHIKKVSKSSKKYIPEPINLDDVERGALPHRRQEGMPDGLRPQAPRPIRARPEIAQAQQEMMVRWMQEVQVVHRR